MSERLRKLMLDVGIDFELQERFDSSTRLAEPVWLPVERSAAGSNVELQECSGAVVKLAAPAALTVERDGYHA